MGLPIHIKKILILLNIRYYIILVLSRLLYIPEPSNFKSFIVPEPSNFKSFIIPEPNIFKSLFLISDWILYPIWLCINMYIRQVIKALGTTHPPSVVREPFPASNLVFAYTYNWWLTTSTIIEIGYKIQSEIPKSDFKSNQKSKKQLLKMLGSGITKLLKLLGSGIVTLLKLLGSKGAAAFSIGNRK